MAGSSYSTTPNVGSVYGNNNSSTTPSVTGGSNSAKPNLSVGTVPPADRLNNYIDRLPVVGTNAPRGEVQETLNRFQNAFPNN